MSVRLRNRSEFEDTDAGCAGTLALTSICGIELIPFPCQLKGVIARLGTAGGTSATTVDILKNGTSIFSSGKINFATSQTVPTYGPLVSNPTTFVKGDIVKVTVTAVGSAPAPADLALALNFQRMKASGVSALTQVDTVGLDAEY